MLKRNTPNKPFKTKLKITLDPMKWARDPRNFMLPDCWTGLPWMSECPKGFSTVGWFNAIHTDAPFLFVMEKYNAAYNRHQAQRMVQKRFAEKGFGYDPDDIIQHGFRYALEKGLISDLAAKGFREVFEWEASGGNPELLLMKCFPRVHKDEQDEVWGIMRHEEKRILAEQKLIQGDYFLKLTDETAKESDPIKSNSGLHRIYQQKMELGFSGWLASIRMKFGMEISTPEDEFVLALYYLNEDFSRDFLKYRSGKITQTTISKRWYENKNKRTPGIDPDSWQSVPKLARPIMGAAGRKKSVPGKILSLCWEVRRALWKDSNRHFADACEVVGLPANNAIRDQWRRLEERIEALRPTRN